MSRTLLISALVFILLPRFAIADAPATQPAYPETDAGLEQCMRDMLDAAAARDPQKLLSLTQALLLPDPKAWFDKTFGAEKGAPLTEEYNKDLSSFPRGLASLLIKLDAPRTLKVAITRIETIDDPNAKGYQRVALAAMQDIVPLYTARIYKEGTSANITLWSMVYVDGRFRLAGKMRAAAKGSSATTLPFDQ